MSESVSRLHLGVSRLEHLSDRVLPYFLDKTWLHYGDGPDNPHEKRTLRAKIRYFRQWTRRKSARQIGDMYRSTNFEQWLYRKGDKLNVGDGQINFIFSEHFFEHMFFDEAIALLRECQRVLRADGVVRICVPDADLRTYCDPEPVGYPSRRMSYTHPMKHRTRWSVYMLSEAMRLVDLTPCPVVYCTLDGTFVHRLPERTHESYKGAKDELVFSFQYMQRPKSLIVDGIKKTMTHTNA